MGAVTLSATGNSGGDDPLFARIAADLLEKNFSVIPNALPEDLAAALHAQLQGLDTAQFDPAGVGRDETHTLNPFVRRDAIRWIAGESRAERHWLLWAEQLRQGLNRELFLGLFSFESHFAHYAPGSFYKKHLDAFKGDTLLPRSNRVVSLVTYFNPGWLPDDGGELLIYQGVSNSASGKQSFDKLPLLRVTPAYASLVVFLSEEVPHEVLPARRDRYSIAGWFRSN